MWTVIYRYFSNMNQCEQLFATEAERKGSTLDGRQGTTARIRASRARVWVQWQRGHGYQTRDTRAGTCAADGHAYYKCVCVLCTETNPS